MTGTDLARATRELKPLEQGDLDGLCGLYAIINALRIAVYPNRIISSRMCGQLLDCGLAFLGRKRKLREAIVYGMDNGLWLAMCEAVVAEAEALLRVRLILQPLMRDDRAWHVPEVIRNIRRNLRQNRAVIICFEGKLEHYSVIAGHTANRLNLFDSAGCRWIHSTSLRVSAKIRKPHLVSREGASVLIYASLG
ncbi:hypothetical protein KZX46_04300 [Polymorphobacter sp. PAMC 29334]|uniref:hypothetical protein n=1 Tax=Polymorphobacter sp. PAMC 29334 TaxID=2862331 RepID=UPI001C799A1D|nr:hypothetical protein [Polymorphobacter sp. PAMC 29334]QYE35229.1 hypothetical protein KZX46_04300 [Polymorphobacter sp. PAMC 29334]